MTSLRLSSGVTECTTTVTSATWRSSATRWPMRARRRATAMGRSRQPAPEVGKVQRDEKSEGLATRFSPCLPLLRAPELVDCDRTSSDCDRTSSCSWRLLDPSPSTVCLTCVYDERRRAASRRGGQGRRSD